MTGHKVHPVAVHTMGKIWLSVEAHLLQWHHLTDSADAAGWTASSESYCAFYKAGGAAKRRDTTNNPHVG
jgi:hypothetical protein